MQERYSRVATGEGIIIINGESLDDNNNNNNDKVYTPLSEKCSQSRVFISQCHIIHIVQYYAYWLVLFM